METLLLELEALQRDAQLQSAIDELIDDWTRRDIGLEGVEAALRFIERYPSLDLGKPGNLVHFVETYYRKGYEEALLRSFARKPTELSTWMLNRLINGTQAADELDIYISALERAETDQDTEAGTREQISHFLDREA